MILISSVPRHRLLTRLGSTFVSSGLETNDSVSSLLVVDWSIYVV